MEQPRRSLGKRGVQCASHYAMGQGCGLSLFDADTKARMALPEVGERPGQKVAGHPADATQNQPARQFPRCAGGIDERVIALQHATRLFDQRAAMGVQTRWPGAAVEKRNPQLVFQGFHLLADRRRRQVKPLGGGQKAFAVGDRNQSAEVANIHALSKES